MGEWVDGWAGGVHSLAKEPGEQLVPLLPSRGVPDKGSSSLNLPCGGPGDATQ